jgi:hypothetical protein
MRMRAVLIGILTLTATVTIGASEPEPLTMKVSPAMSFAPANLVVRASIQPNADNRVFEVVAESDDFYRSSEVQLDGERAPRTNSIEYRSLPPGQYEVRAVLLGADGRPRATVRQSVVVVGAGAGF